MKSILDLNGVNTLNKEAQASINGGDTVCNQDETMVCVGESCWCAKTDILNLDDWYPGKPSN